MRRWLAGIILAVLLTVGLLGIWLQRELATPYFGGENQECFVDIPRGSGTAAIAEALKSGGILHYRLPFLIYVRWTRAGRRLQAGEYSLPRRLDQPISFAAWSGVMFFIAPSPFPRA